MTIPPQHISDLHRFLGSVRYSAGVLLIILSFVLTPQVLAEAQKASDPDSELADPPKANTTVIDVRRGSASGTGSLGLLTFKFGHDIVSSISASERVGGARVARADYPAAFAGAWAQAGELGGWITPTTEVPNATYEPTTFLVENAYFDNALTTEALSAVTGDHVEFGMAVVPMDTPMPWSRVRTDRRGSLGWESTVVTQEVQSRFSGVPGEVDVIMFRVDVVARGGDVDARAQPLHLEPLVLDLPRVYDEVPNYVGLAGIGKPHLNYITDFSVVPAPTAGKLVVRAEVSGYIPEAQVYTLPNGAVMKEWHIPLTGVIVIDRANSDLTPVASASMPFGGTGLIVDRAGTRRVKVSPGGTLSAKPGDSQHRETDSAEDTQSIAFAGANAEFERAELMAAAAANHTLDQTVDLDLQTSAFRATLDPNYRGEQALALRNVLNVRANKSYADALTVPAAVVDSQTVLLDRSRLTDLRVLPFRDGGGVGVKGTAAFEEYNQTASTFNRVYHPGLFVHAVYDLGDNLHAFVEHQLFHGGVPPGGRVNSNVVFRALDGRTINAYPTQYVDLTEPGPAVLSGVERTTEFTAGTAGFFGNLEVGNHHTNSDYRTATRIFGGKISVLLAPAPLLGRAPDANAAIAGQKLTLIQEPPANMPSSPTTLTVFRVGLADGPVRTPPAPPPIGERCDVVAVTDLSIADAPPQSDVREAWFDADGSNIYVSLRLAEVPAQALSPTGDRYAVTWRSNHDGYTARATLLPTGAWEFVLGDLTFGSYFQIRKLTGEVQPGPNGVIRMAIPRDTLDYEDGTLLRDTAVYAYSGTTNVPIDHAPEGSSFAYGLGNDHLITSCPVSSVELVAVASRKLHGSVPFDVDLPLATGPGIECRSGGANGDYTLVFRFSNNLVSVGDASVTSGTGSVSSSAIDAGDADQYIVNLTGVTNAQSVTVTLANVSDSAGQSGTTFSASMGVLLGDTTNSGAVNSSDISQTKSQSGQLVTTSNFRQDVTADGSINSSDISLVKSKSGTALP